MRSNIPLGTDQLRYSGLPKSQQRVNPWLLEARAYSKQIFSPAFVPYYAAILPSIPRLNAPLT